MEEKKKKSGKLATYAIIMLLTAIIVIIIAAMADNREESFQNQIEETTQANTTIQEEVVRLKNENYDLKNQLEKLQQEKDKLSFMDYIRSIIKNPPLLVSYESFVSYNEVSSYMRSSLRMLAIFSLVAMVVGTKGRRNTFSIYPMSLSRALTPAGLPSTKSSL